MKVFTEAMRHDYPLTPDSCVIDCGGFEGNFAKIITEKYGCCVQVLEPVKRFRDSMHRSPLILVHPYGVAGESRDALFNVGGDSSGEFATGLPHFETVQLRAIGYVLAELAPKGCDLLKLNIEGAEFEVLEMMVSTGARLAKNIQVQFHRNVPDYEARYEAIAVGLSYTHHLTYRAPWCWENWEIN